MWLFAVALVLVSTGVVMVYSASAIVAGERFGDSYFFLKKQVVWVLLGLGGLWAALRFDHRNLQRLVLPLLVVTAAMLLFVLIPPFGQVINGTRRWLRLGVVSFQPAELAKLVLVVYLAAHAARLGEGIRDFWRGLVPPLVVTAVFAGLILKQPDLGNSLAVLGLSLIVLFLAGARPRHLALLSAPAVLAIAVAVVAAPYRVRRVLSFLNPEADPLGGGFQIIQSYLAIGSGGLLGRGLGGSRQKLFYLPESHTDFIFSVIGEELGLVGGVAVITLFALLIWRGLRIGLRAPEPFGAHLALGITVMLATQTIVNIGVVTGSLPTKGLPLPFISFGGSALFMTMVATGILLNISQSSGLFAPAVGAARGPSRPLTTVGRGATPPSERYV